MLELSKKTLAGYRALLKEAVAAGELKPHGTARMARAINALAGGSEPRGLLCPERGRRHALRRPVEHRVEQQLERPAGLRAEIHLAAERDDVTVADAERDHVRVIAQQVLAEQSSALQNRSFRRVA